MRYSILGLGYAPIEQIHERIKWQKHGIAFEFAESINDAAERIRKRNYDCVVLRTEAISQGEVAYLYSMNTIPMLIIPSNCSAKVAHAGICIGTFQLAVQSACVDSGIVHDVWSEQKSNLTRITAKDLSFCLEYRTVEIRGNKVELTEKEFDILALLLMNPKKVFTYEMIIDAVWREDPLFYSSKTVSTHISNLRRKLKIEPDTPEYIKSVRGVGYKFEVSE